MKGKDSLEKPSPAKRDGFIKEGEETHSLFFLCPDILVDEDSLPSKNGCEKRNDVCELARGWHTRRKKQELNYPCDVSAVLKLTSAHIVEWSHNMVVLERREQGNSDGDPTSEGGMS